MDLVLILGGIFIVGIVLGWLGATHVHSIAKANTAATTLSASEVAALNTKVAGLGDQMKTVLAKIGTAENAALTSAAQPKS